MHAQHWHVHRAHKNGIFANFMNGFFTAVLFAFICSNSGCRNESMAGNDQCLLKIRCADWQMVSSSRHLTMKDAFTQCVTDGCRHFANQSCNKAKGTGNGHPCQLHLLLRGVFIHISCHTLFSFSFLIAKEVQILSDSSHVSQRKGKKRQLVLSCFLIFLNKEGPKQDTKETGGRERIRVWNEARQTRKIIDFASAPCPPNCNMHVFVVTNLFSPWAWCHHVSLAHGRGLVVNFKCLVDAMSCKLQDIQDVLETKNVETVRKLQTFSRTTLQKSANREQRVIQTCLWHTSHSFASSFWSTQFHDKNDQKQVKHCMHVTLKSSSTSFVRRSFHWKVDADMSANHFFDKTITHWWLWDGMNTVFVIIVDQLRASNDIPSSWHVGWRKMIWSANGRVAGQCEWLASQLTASAAATSEVTATQWQLRTNECGTSETQFGSLHVHWKLVNDIPCPWPY